MPTLRCQYFKGPICNKKKKNSSQFIKNWRSGTAATLSYSPKAWEMGMGISDS